jgi:hypothetical protein
MTGLNLNKPSHTHTRHHHTEMTLIINTIFAAMAVRAFRLNWTMHLDYLRGLQAARPHGHVNLLRILIGYTSTTVLLASLEASLQTRDTAQNLLIIGGRIMYPVTKKSGQQ